MDKESECKRSRTTFRIAVAVAVVRSKPAHLNTSEYCEQLRQSAIAKALQWRRERSVLGDETIRLKKEVIALRIAANASSQLHTAELAVSRPMPDRGESDVPASLPSQGERCLAADTFYESTLNACTICTSSRAIGSESCSEPIVSEAVKVLLDALGPSVCPAGAIAPQCHRGALADLVIGALVGLDHRLPVLTSGISVRLEDFFSDWISRNVLDDDRTAHAQPWLREQAVCALRRLSARECLRESILEAAVSHLSRLTSEMTGGQRFAFDVRAWEQAAILMLLMEHLLEPGPRARSGRHDQRWQRLLGHCFNHLQRRFPLYVHRICRLTCHLGRL